MWEIMAASKDLRKAPTTSVPPAASAAAIARQVRVEELRRLVATGAYKVDPRRLALRIWSKAVGRYSPEKRT
jgi:anti-sigma28 factor (negative regulator of flagellin synthesis)